MDRTAQRRHPTQMRIFPPTNGLHPTRRIQRDESELEAGLNSTTCLGFPSLSPHDTIAGVKKVSSHADHEIRRDIACTMSGWTLSSLNSIAGAINSLGMSVQPSCSPPVLAWTQEGIGRVHVIDLFQGTTFGMQRAEQTNIVLLELLAGGFRFNNSSLNQQTDFFGARSLFVSFPCLVEL
ncbi:uncharacterized protein BJX67DRAFT_333661 [Aspergillus lucknowensis]|uniref:Uncharacterized protein n=1 Tax=Aspergillus lucknowensis TaxID=176173 RepID=A0ABR4LYK8_9EURO